jgi:3-phosphoshikimate 1-carboxyvinyltransferase
MVYSISKPNRHISGEVTLAGSKSISNRALIIRALCPEPFVIYKLANANDTGLLLNLLEQDAEVYDAGPAGTTFRFLTAYLSLQDGVQVLTGSERMKQRPIGVLVEALRSLGARIDYLEKEGYPPLRIGKLELEKASGKLFISASTSSQYISALLMIAPTLPNGLELTLEGKIVSRTYIEMTLKLMAYFGIQYQWEGNVISVPAQTYRPRPFTVEADWSAASYYYALAAFADELDLQLNGLFEHSVQGDAILPRMMESLGIETRFNNDGIQLLKKEMEHPGRFEWDFILCPDLAQTLAVICAGLDVEGLFCGLETLRIKETDRIAALQTELAKTGVQLTAVAPEERPQPDKEYFRVKGKARWSAPPRFATYEDHRMAMAFAPLAMFGPMEVADPMVVGKSYPDFWADLESLGFEISR